MSNILFFAIPLAFVSFIGVFYFALIGLNKKLNEDVAKKKMENSMPVVKTVEEMQKEINVLKYQMQIFTKLIQHSAYNKKSSANVPETYSATYKPYGATSPKYRGIERPLTSYIHKN